MKVALFLDLDGVLTPKAVNLQFAYMMGVEKELLGIEADYRNGIIDNAQFNEKFIPLFKKSGFNEQFVKKNLSKIVLSSFAEELIQQNLPDTFLVTSSPSYYVRYFARRFRIPKENIICSEYQFSKTGEFLECLSPSGFLDKANFVENEKRKHDFDITVGVGDSPEQDGKFLNLCDLRILMSGERENYLHANDLYTIASVIKLLRRQTAKADGSMSGIPVNLRRGVEKLRKHGSPDKLIFIMTPFRKDARYKLAIRTIKNELKTYGYKGFTADDYDLSDDNDLWVNVRCFMHGCAHGIALLTADEILDGNKTEIRKDVFNPNVLTESGYMLGLGKEILLLKDERIKLPADWLGKLFHSINFTDPENDIIKAIKKWMTTRIKED